MSEEQEHVSTVRGFSEVKGWGFIYHPDGEEHGDVFVHWRSIAGSGFKTLKTGQRVRFVLTETERGWAAKEVVPL